MTLNCTAGPAARSVDKLRAVLRRTLFFACLVAVAVRLFSGVRWTNPAGSHYADQPDSADARGSFVRGGFLFTLRVEGGRFSVWAWDLRNSGWTPWSHSGGSHASVPGDIDHVIAVGPRVVTVLMDAGAQEREDVRRCETWSVEIDDTSRTLTWRRVRAETRDLSSISNYAAEAEAYYGVLNAERLGLPSSPSHINEDYVQGSATKQDAVAFGVGDGLHVYSLPNRTGGRVQPAIARTFALRTGQIAGTNTGWFMVARVSPWNSWEGPTIVFVNKALKPTSVIPLTPGFHSYLEAAGDANVVFDGGQRFAWRIRGDEAERIEWSQLIPNGHIAATADSRSLFLTDGERIAVPVRTERAARYPAEGLNVGGTTVVVREGTKARAAAAATIVIALLAIGGMWFRSRAAYVAERSR